MAVAKSLSAIEHKYKGLTRKARIRRISQKTCVFRSFRGIRVERFWLCYNQITAFAKPAQLHTESKLRGFFALL